MEGDRRRREPDTVEQAEDLRHGLFAAIDVEPDEAILAGRLAHEWLQPDGLEDAFRGAVDADRDDVAGDLPLELVGGALGHDLALVDDREAVGEGVGLLEVVGRQEDRRAQRSEVADLLPHAGAGLRVEARRRLVEEQHSRPMDDPQADVEPALHAAGIRAGRPVSGGFEVEGCEYFAGAGLSLRHAHPIQAALDHELATAGLGRVGRAPLRDVADALANGLGLTAKVGSSDRGLAGRGRQQGREHSQCGRLAGHTRCAASSLRHYRIGGRGLRSAGDTTASISQARFRGCPVLA